MKLKDVQKLVLRIVVVDMSSGYALNTNVEIDGNNDLLLAALSNERFRESWGIEGMTDETDISEIQIKNVEDECYSYDTNITASFEFKGTHYDVDIIKEGEVWDKDWLHFETEEKIGDCEIGALTIG